MSDARQEAPGESGSSAEDALIASRRAKAAKLRARGENPFANDVVPQSGGTTVDIADLRAKAASARGDDGKYAEERVKEATKGAVFHVRGRVIGFGGRVLGEMEESFFGTLAVGDTFMFGGEVVAFEGMRENEAFVSRAQATDPKIPSYMGGKFPLSTYLAERVRRIMDSPDEWRKLPEQVETWLRLQRDVSVVPQRDSLLVETFPRGTQNFLVCYPFEGRLAHQTLGMLLTRRLERARARPLGFVASEYALAIWGLGDLSALIRTGRLSLDELFSEDMLGDDLEDWLDESALMKRTFRNCAIIAGLIDRRHPGKEKTGRQLTMSSDLIYDVLYQHEPDHILIQATRRDAARGLLDIERLGHMLKRIRTHIVHKPLTRISPLAVPVMLDIGREPIFGEGRESAMAEAADELMREALGPT